MGGKSPGPLSLVISASWAGFVQIVVTEFHVEKWKCVTFWTLNADRHKVAFAVFYLQKSSQEAAQMQDVESSACGPLMEVATMSQCKWVKDTRRMIEGT